MSESTEESVVQIDENNLDRECIRLPSDYLKFAHAAVNAKRDVDEAKAKLDVVEADMKKDVRDNPGKYGLEKVTEGALADVVTRHSRFQKAREEYSTAQHQSNLAQAVVWALEHKKRTLTLLVELYGMGYFSSPKLSEKGQEAVNEMTRKKVHRKFRDDE